MCTAIFFLCSNLFNLKRVITIHGICNIKLLSGNMYQYGQVKTEQQIHYLNTVNFKKNPSEDQALLLVLK